MNRNNSISFFAIVILILIPLTIAGCQPAATSTEIVENVVNDPQPEEPVNNDTGFDAYEFDQSDSGYITLHGLLVVRDPTSMLPAPDDAVYLVPVGGEGQGVSSIPQFTPGEVPQAEVDERTGEFVFINIEPGKYAIVAVTVGGAQIPTRKMDDGNYAIITFVEDEIDQVVELGSLSLP